MITEIKRFILNNNLIKKDEHIICALSGGPDSIFMFEILHQLSSIMGYKISICHINHQLRENDSYEDMLAVKKICEINKIIFDYQTVNTKLFCIKNKYSIETGARIIRYTFFKKLLNKYMNSKIATAHNYNDNVETIIFNLIRGCYTLKGIPLNKNCIIRPLLNTKREMILNYLHKNNIKYQIDITNFDNNYSRNKIRNLIFPIFNLINNKYDENIINTYKIVNNENYYLSKKTENLIKKIVYFDGTIVKINISKLKNINFFLIKRILNTINKNFFNIQLTYKQTNNIINILFSQNPSSKLIIHNYIFRKQYNELYIHKYDEFKDDCKLLTLTNKEIVLNKDIELIKKKLFINIKIIENKFDINFKKNDNVFYINYDKLDISSLHLRSRKTNDKICLDKLGYRKIKHIFINKKIPKIYRDSIPVLVDKNNILCCLFIGINHEYNITINTKKIFVVEFRGDFYEDIFNR